MKQGAHRAPGRPVGAGLLLLLFAALAYGTVECLWQAYVSPPAEGLPGAAGASWPMMVCLAVTVFLWPALLARLLFLRLEASLRRPLVLLAGLLPTWIVALDHMSQTRQWEWMGASDVGSTALLPLLATAGLASLLGVSVMELAARWLDRRFDLPRSMIVAIVTVSLLSPLGFWILRPMPPQQLPEAQAASDRPNLLLITIDTLRQDAVGAYGGPASTTMDSLIATGTRFDGWAVSSWTRPSMASFFTGVAPTGTGVSEDHAMRADLRTWVERLRDEGYVTAAVASNPHLRARFGFDRGFAYFDHSDHIEWLAPVVRSFWGIWLQRTLVDHRETDRGDLVVDRTRYWWEHRRPTDRPWLLWVHFMDPHLPYNLRGPHGEKIAADDPAWLSELGPEFQDGFFRDLPAVREGRALTSAAARGALRELYQREVLFADRQLSRLLDMVRSPSDDRGLLWVLASDHGEEFWDDGGFEHGHSLHRSVLQVPLAMGGDAALPADHYAGPLRLSDVGPTLLGLLSVEGFDPAAGAMIEDFDDSLRAYVVGQDRSEWLQRSEGFECRWPALMAEGMFYGPPQTRILREDGRSLLRQDLEQRVIEQWLCDPDEPATPHTLSELSGHDRSYFLEIDLWRERSAGLAPKVEDDPELDRRLRALGYMQ
jgi:arylsulfatase A-like enzyme